MAQPLPTYFISHGGGPWPWLPDRRAMFAPLEASLAAMPSELAERPRAILMISGHWEADSYRVMAAPNPPMVYDYYNFPPHTYEVTYPAPGAPDLARRAAELIRAAGLPSELDTTQGFDHGTFAPLAIMYPDADMPVFQVSLRHGYDPAEHMALGRALAPLREEGVLIVGSGLSYHNLRLMGPEAREPSEAFDGWLNHALTQPPETRTDLILNWEQAPHARTCHAEEDHFAPLFVALGAAEQAETTQVYHQKEVFGGMTASGFRFDG
ncbi:DODA-type extradiol aromatic ring-opening family dioxygenase [Shimia sediminis]|uniref:DODA-type extradiol aromatic ring-opening family dioxygenase n=1 Tax=Shimia sediminis TaxID=2497945 RepID=UPI000F8E34C6|nr:class III extradiol ring-cleavage dioxygenase [Shimia sediminis]